MIKTHLQTSLDTDRNTVENINETKDKSVRTMNTEYRSKLFLYYHTDDNRYHRNIMLKCRTFVLRLKPLCLHPPQRIFTKFRRNVQPGGPLCCDRFVRTITRSPERCGETANATVAGLSTGFAGCTARRRRRRRVLSPLSPARGN